MWVCPCEERTFNRRECSSVVTLADALFLLWRGSSRCVVGVEYPPVGLAYLIHINTLTLQVSQGGTEVVKVELTSSKTTQVKNSGVGSARSPFLTPRAAQPVEELLGELWGDLVWPVCVCLDLPGDRGLSVGAFLCLLLLDDLAFSSRSGSWGGSLLRRNHFV